MLPAAVRMRSAETFRQTVNYGARAGSPSVVVYALPSSRTQIGFVVSKKVGNAVVRNRVKRRLRHLARPLITDEPVQVVIRALPLAAVQPQRLASDFATAWHSCLTKMAMTT